MNENQKAVFELVNHYIKNHELNTMQAIYWSITNALDNPESEFASAFKKLSNDEVNTVLSECIKQ